MEPWLADSNERVRERGIMREGQIEGERDRERLIQFIDVISVVFH